ncbi:rap1 GTPase-GDP dissociation stimulator 1-like isoform X2 [Pomacea canaliculata]|uniref:rap1 GTPase-GDP dissociation stimulator 1-like isoform X2 n=1 Tax=Pomacea canaliculata TaxID=400727 RepID=UPI000D737DA0|nr:rap1 GTPase-GDP dissociation stimulator 1-like isoform X2 [Pomacea canaliculata]
MNTAFSIQNKSKDISDMEDLHKFLQKFEQTSSPEEQEKYLDAIISLISDRNKDDEEDIPQAIMKSHFMSKLFPCLQETALHTSLTAKSAQLIAELAKTESLRVPLVKMSVVSPLLNLLTASVASPAVATQACRALGNICFDNDEGRAAVNEGGGMAALLSLLQRYISSTEDGACKLRVIACGFILNLTNECETLQEQAVKAGVLGLLDQCLHQHPDDEDLVNMAMASIISIADSEMGRKQVCETGILDTLLEVVEREETGASLCQVLEQLNSLAENVETMRNRLAEGSLPSHLVRIIQFNSGKGSQDREECVKLSSDLLLSLLVGDGSMEKLYGGGEGMVFKQCVQWLEAKSDSLKVLGALAVGNFARSDAHCKQLVDVGIVEALLSGLAAGDGAEPSFTLQHAVLSSLRNLAIPASNKARLLEAGVMRAVLELKHTEVMAVVFKLLGVLRMLTDGQEAAALALGQDHDFLVCLVDWCAVEEHAGVKGEAVRLLASMIKNSKSSQVMRNIVREEGLPHLVSMATSEHLVMQNEALIALTLVASTIPGDAAVSLKEADLVGTVSGLVKNKSAPAELLCNVLTLVRSLSTAGMCEEYPLLMGWIIDSLCDALIHLNVCLTPRIFDCMRQIMHGHRQFIQLRMSL